MQSQRRKGVREMIEYASDVGQSLGSAGIIIVLVALCLTMCFWTVDTQLRMWYPRRKLRKGERPYSPADYTIHMGMFILYCLSGNLAAIAEVILLVYSIYFSIVVGYPNVVGVFLVFCFCLLPHLIVLRWKPTYEFLSEAGEKDEWGFIRAVK